MHTTKYDTYQGLVLKRTANEVTARPVSVRAKPEQIPLPRSVLRRAEVLAQEAVRHEARRRRVLLKTVLANSLIAFRLSVL